MELPHRLAYLLLAAALTALALLGCKVSGERPELPALSERPRSGDGDAPGESEGFTGREKSRGVSLLELCSNALGPPDAYLCAPYTIRIKGIHGFDENTALIYGNFARNFRHSGGWHYYYLLARTSDGGLSWSFALHPEPKTSGAYELEELRFVDGNHGWIHGVWQQGDSDYTLFRTEDGGVRWEECGRAPVPNTQPSLGPWGFTSPTEGKAAVFVWYGSITIGAILMDDAELEACRITQFGVPRELPEYVYSLRTIALKKYLSREKDADMELVWCIVSTSDGGKTWQLDDFIVEDETECKEKGIPDPPDYSGEMKCLASKGGWSVKYDEQSQSFIVERDGPRGRESVAEVPEVVTPK